MPNNSSPKKISLAIQGGGAKIVTLLATLEALQELEEKGEIKVVEVFGTSAGAIVGALFTAGIDIKSIRESLQGKDGELLLKEYGNEKVSILSKFKFIKTTTKYKDFAQSVKKLLKNKPIWNDDVFEHWLTDIFKAKNITSIRQLNNERGVPLTIVSTNLSNNAVHKYDDNDDLVTSLLDSSGLPYLFRIWGNNSGSVIVDGGLCDNLPANFIGERTDDTYSVAISFLKAPATKIDSLQNFSIAILDTAIESAMQKTRTHFKGLTYNIDTDIGTFDFNKALNEGLKSHYDLKKIQCRDWFQKNIIHSKPSSSPMYNNPWEDTNTNVSSFMYKLNNIFNKQHGDGKYNVHKMEVLVDANCLAERGGFGYGSPDVVVYKYHISAKEKPIYCISYNIFNAPEGAEFTNEYISIKATSKGNNIETVQLPICDDSQALKKILIYFEEPITTADGIVEITMTEEVIDLMRNLRNGLDDNISFTNTKADCIDELSIVLNYPSSFGKLHYTSDTGSIIDETDLTNHANNPKIKSIGWKYSSVPKDKRSNLTLFKNTKRGQGVK